MIHALLLLSISFTSLLGAGPSMAAPVLDRLQETDPMAVPAQAAILLPSFQLNSATEPLASLSATASKGSPVSTSSLSLAQRMRERAGDVVSTALNFLGMPYRHGGSSESTGFDCSGFTRYMFEMSVGLVLPRIADQQAKAPGLAAVKRDQLQPGDLVFFNTLRRTFSHVGIYIGEGKFIHAPKPGAEVRVEDMGVAYWAQRFTGARRADPDVDPMDASSLASASVQDPVLSAAAPAAVMRSASVYRKTPHRQVRRRHH